MIKQAENLLRNLLLLKHNLTIGILHTGDKMFNLGNFIEDCKVSISNDQSHLGIKELVESAASNPGDLIAALGPLEKAGATTIYHSDELTIVNVT